MICDPVSYWIAYDFWWGLICGATFVVAWWGYCTWQNFKERNDIP